jgi:regulator of replication initiation timing
VYIHIHTYTLHTYTYIGNIKSIESLHEEVSVLQNSLEIITGKECQLRVENEILDTKLSDACDKLGVNRKKLNE